MMAMSPRLPQITVSVLGLGYIGLPTAAAFAARGVRVVGVDINQHTVDIISRGQVHIVEPELDMVVHAAVSQGYLRATMRPEPADAFLVAVPTPLLDDKQPDLGYISAACASLAPVLRAGNVVILESTSPIGTTDLVSEWLAHARPDLTFPHQAGEASDIRVAYCPERVLPGRVMLELIENDRIIGGMTRRCSEAAAEIYKIFVRGECFITSARTAEMCKLAENSFRDVNIAFANELSMVCDEVGVNVWDLIRLANRHPRVAILNPGPGVGGHCIAIDPWFLVHSAPRHTALIRAARGVNDGKPEWVVDKVLAEAALVADRKGISLSDVRLAVLGLTFKADIDDLRESPAMRIAQSLARSFPGNVVAVEPNVDELPLPLANLGVRKVDLERALEFADVVVVLVDHREFRGFSYASRPGTALVDTKGIWLASE